MKMNGLSLRDLEYIVAVAEYRHFGKAANGCAVSQPALSIQIRRLEQKLGVMIFERSSRRVFLTAHGSVIVDQARTILNEAERLLELAERGTGPMSGILRLSAISTLGPYVFPLILRPFKATYPEVELILGETQTVQLVEDLRAGTADVGLLATPLDAPDLHLEPVFFEPFVLIHAPNNEVAPNDPPSICDLPAEGLLLLEEGHCLREQALSLCHRAAPSLQRRHATSLETLRHMVAAGEGWSILPQLAVPEVDPLRGLICYKRFAEPDVGRTVALAWRRNSARAEEHLLLADLLRQVLEPCDVEAM